MLLHPIGPGLEKPGRFLIAVAETAEQQPPFFVAANAAQHLPRIPRPLPARQNVLRGIFGQWHRGDLIVVTGEEVALEFGPVAFGIGVGGDHHLLGQHRTALGLH